MGEAREGAPQTGLCLLSCVHRSSGRGLRCWRTRTTAHVHSCASCSSDLWTRAGDSKPGQTKQGEHRGFQFTPSFRFCRHARTGSTPPSVLTLGEWASASSPLGQSLKTVYHVSTCPDDHTPGAMVRLEASPQWGKPRRVSGWLQASFVCPTPCPVGRRLFLLENWKREEAQTTQTLNGRSRHYRKLVFCSSVVCLACIKSSAQSPHNIN